MEAVFFRVHERSIKTITRFSSKRARKVIERLMLIIGIFLLTTLANFHREFPQNSKTKHNCIKKALEGTNFDISNIHILRLHLNEDIDGNPTVEREQSYCSRNARKNSIFYKNFWPSSENRSKVKESVTSSVWYSNKRHGDKFHDCAPEKTYSFSLDRGLLMLSEMSHFETIEIDIHIPIWDDCVGSFLSRVMLSYVVGYDSVVLNWITATFGHNGYLYNSYHKELINLNRASKATGIFERAKHYFLKKVGIFFTSVFLFFTTTTIVSFTLRETQERMLRFAFNLQHNIRNRQPYGPLVLTHVVENSVFVPIMVGILFFLFEFFSDRLLAFMVLSVVWMCEVFSVMSVRTATAIRFYPKITFVYFSMFYTYFFSFPFGFGYLALITLVLFLLHLMVHFLNNYEIPALMQRRVRIDRPRMMRL